MPAKYSNRTLEVEQGLAKTIAANRIRLELTYEGLSERMKEIGCEIHPSGIQKTEKSGRRITVEELVAYSVVFGLSVDQLLGADDSTSDLQFQTDLSSAVVAVMEADTRAQELALTRNRIMEACLDTEAGERRIKQLSDGLASLSKEGTRNESVVAFVNGLLLDITMERKESDHG